MDKPVESFTSPLAKCVHAYDTFAAAGKEPIKVKRQRRKHDMEDKFCPLTPREFLNDFVPPSCDEERRNFKKAFNKVPIRSSKSSKSKRRSRKRNSLEKEMYEPFISCVKAANMCPGYEFAVISEKADPDDATKQRVDAGLFRKEDVPADKRPHWAKQRLWIEFKRDASSDPFDDRALNAEGMSFEATAKARQDGRAQLISYAEMIFAAQQRAFLFTISILGDYARIIRWDRSGACATHRFDYKTHSEILGDFLWRFAHLGDRQQGYDTTASWIEENSDDYKLMHDAVKTAEEEHQYVKDYFEKSLEGKWSGWKLVVEDEPDNTDEADKTGEGSKATAARRPARTFLVGKAHFAADGMVGRGTRGYIAYDPKANKFFFLKDAWRVALPDILKEGQVIGLLNKKGVGYVPTLECHGDVCDYVEGAGENGHQVQCTKTQDIWARQHPQVASRDVQCPLKTHFHYRLVEREIGRPLRDFGNGQELVKVVIDCLTAHSEAMSKANVMHRDISAGNILIRYALREIMGKREMIPEGFLNDWEFSKLMVEGKRQRQPDRTGTWQFQSALILMYPEKPVEIADELEAFFHVLVYNGIRYLRHNCRSVGTFMHDFFDEAVKLEDGYSCGHKKWFSMCAGSLFANKAELLRFLPDSSQPTGATTLNDVLYGEHPLNQLIAKLLSWFKAHYDVVLSSGLAQPSRPSVGMITSNRTITGQARSMGEKFKALFSSANSKSKRAKDMGSDDEDENPHQQDRLFKKAANLKMHTKMLQLLTESMADTWPLHDKTVDQLPPNFNYEETRDYGTGMKRRSEFPESANKRPRTLNLPVPTAPRATSPSPPQKTGVASSMPSLPSYPLRAIAGRGSFSIPGQGIARGASRRSSGQASFSSRREGETQQMHTRRSSSTSRR